MVPFEKIDAFYRTHLPNAKQTGHLLSAPCPFCESRHDQKPGILAVQMNPKSHFAGYFRCTQRCTPGGFHHHFGRLMGLDGKQVPGFDPEQEGPAMAATYPGKNLSSDIDQFRSLLGSQQAVFFERFGISAATLKEMKVGFNGRYWVYPYVQENGQAYAARCVMPEHEEESFWHGDEDFTAEAFRIFNVQAIDRCQGGALFITDGEINQLILTELGYPAIAVPTIADLKTLSPDRLAGVENIFLICTHSPEARLAERELAVGLGFKARILQWPSKAKRGLQIKDLAEDSDTDLKKTVARMLLQSKSFSPFASVQKEQRKLSEFLEHEKGKNLLGLETGFERLDATLEGLRGINIMGGPPKAGKSCFFMQISTQIAQKGTSVIYYDFENGRQKIYLRTLVRISGLPEKKIRQGSLNSDEADVLKTAWSDLETMLTRFKVVTDRQLTPDVMRRHIDFIKHETRQNDLLVVVDSLHKLPFRDLSERRTGIDSWLRHFEAIRDEQLVCFLVISELSRGKGGGYGERPDLSSFKESGDIEYSADNALILSPNWDPLEPQDDQGRKNILWLVASRENSPGQVAEYRLDYPFWRFIET